MNQKITGALAVAGLALLTVLAALAPDEGTTATFSSAGRADRGGGDPGIFTLLFSLAGKWPFVALLAVLTGYAAFVLWRLHAAPPARATAARRAGSSDAGSASGQAGHAVQGPVATPPSPPLADADRQLAQKMVAGLVAQVQHEQRLEAARGREPVSLRLVPQVPVREPDAPRAWFGGGARLPQGMAWPAREGVPLQVLLQLSCTLLPQGLWEGLGPREGWLAVFLHPATLEPLVLHFPQDGPWQASPPLDAGCHFVGLDLRAAKDSERPPPVPALTYWPLDVVAVVDGVGDPRREGSCAVAHERYAQDWDATETRFHPFDWEGARVMLGLALATAEQRLTTRPAPHLAPEVLARMEAALVRARESGEPPEQLMASQLQLDEYRAMARVHEHARLQGPALLEQLRALKAEVDVMAVTQPFSAERLEPVWARLRGLEWPSHRVPPGYRDGRKLTIEERLQEGVTVRSLPVTRHDPDRRSWANAYVHHLHDRAKHLYTRHPDALPAALRADAESVWRRHAEHEMGGMGHVPWGYVHEFDDRTDVTLLELPSSALINWQFGDLYDLVLTIAKADLARGRFDRVKVQVSN